LTGTRLVHYLSPLPTLENRISLEFLIWAPVLLFSVVAHEYAHAEAAYRQGDDTAYLLGRLTLNPLKHIDPFMTVLLPALLYVSHAGFIFGGAKPVPVDPSKYRNYRRGDIIVSLAGIAVNLALYLASAVSFAIVGLVASWVPAASGVVEIMQRMLVYGMLLNLVLAFFNLTPVPPLDGSHVVAHLLPPEVGLKYRRLFQFGFFPILILVWLLPGVVQVLMWPAMQLMHAALSLVGRFAVSAAVFRT
jgi:Zn-dependent protease